MEARAWFRPRGLSTEDDSATGLGDLLIQVARGDRDSFERVYAQISGPVYGMVLRVLRDPSQSEEVAQEVLVDVWRQASRFDPARGMQLSAIFKWYAEDFRKSDRSVRSFVLAHRPAGGAVRSDLPVTYLDYDWALNGSW